MKNIYILFLLLCCSVIVTAQDTFSIVAVDAETGEVGSAGASCVDLTNFGLDPDFLGELFPGVGAINTQAWYIGQNQANARDRMNAGDSPQEIIDWLVANDIQGNPTLRQYGVVRIIDNDPFSAAHTGTSTDDYKGHRTGANYAIQGNILLGPEILDSMEANFVNTQGTLAQKLMAALQGANVAGADSRCLSNGTSSLFAFLKVAQPGDTFGEPSLVLGVDFADNSGIEPIDSLQSLFDLAFPPNSLNELIGVDLQVYPNPAREYIRFEIEGDFNFNDLELNIFDYTGKLISTKDITQNKLQLTKTELGQSGLFLYQLKSKSSNKIKSGKIVFY